MSWHRVENRSLHAIKISKENETRPMYNAYDRDIAKVKFFFSKSTVHHFEKRARASNLDYLAQVGGIFGFCVGCSLISGIEFFYWIIIKLFTVKLQSSRKNHREIKKLTPSLKY